MAGQNTDEDTPLHTAARFGVPELTALYLAHGADVDVGNSRLETPLITAAYWAFCQREQLFSPDHHLVCRMLLDNGANPDLQEEDNKTALHKAAWNADHTLIEMLLSAGADAKAMDINGCAPIQYLLKVTQVRPSSIPELCYQLLLNHGGARIYPPQFHKVNTRQPSSRMFPLVRMDFCQVYVSQEIMRFMYTERNKNNMWVQACNAEMGCNYVQIQVLYL